MNAVLTVRKPPDNPLGAEVPTLEDEVFRHIEDDCVTVVTLRSGKREVWWWENEAKRWHNAANDDSAWLWLDWAEAAHARAEKLDTENAALRIALSEALDEWQDASAYKGKHLAEKHGDAELIAGYRKLLGAEPTQRGT